ncbi:hypothetical protein MUO66_00240, partial [Candidatus Bathyarchaeota archaeon]|nr:hypothetical protein [Candidatus Bathyarchaeota archaeon]
FQSPKIISFYNLPELYARIYFYQHSFLNKLFILAQSMDYGIPEAMFVYTSSYRLKGVIRLCARLVYLNNYGLTLLF